MDCAHRLIRHVVLGYLAAALLPGLGFAQRVARPNYGEALQKTIYFYEAQRSGRLPDNNRVPWRGDSALQDGAEYGVDLTGGWYDAGDHVKFGFPMASSAALLAWSALEYPNAFVASRQLAPLLDNLRWVADYFLKASAQPDQLWGQVGNGAIDHAWWGPAEVMVMPRPAYRITATCPGSDLAGETAAAMAAMSMVFRNNDDTEYADGLLARAKNLYTFAERFRGRYSDCITDAASFYRSWNGYQDELVWGAIWLHWATGEAPYLQKAKAYYEELPKQPGLQVRSFAWTHNWDDKSYGSYVLMSKLTGQATYRADSERWLDFWTTGTLGQRVRYTPGGLAWLDQWGSLRYAANTAFLAFVYSDWLASQGADGARISRYRSFAERQIDYMLGDNPRGRSYVIGFGPNPPRNPHHRTAHGSWANNIAIPSETTHILYGALVGGPDANDNFSDTRADFVKNEVATDYNAGFVGALARMYLSYGGMPLLDFPGRQPPTRDEFLIDAKVNAQGSSFIEVAAFLTNRTAWPARLTDRLSLRYFFTLDGEDPADIRVNAAFNECRPPSPPVTWSGSTYYVQVDCTGVPIFPGGQSDYRKQTQFRITSRGNWDPTNDWSYQGLAELHSQPSRAVNLVLYDGGMRVWGNEPGGGEPVPLAINTPRRLPQGRAGVSYWAELQAIGGAPPYSDWKVITGSLPPGLVLDAENGRIAGIPEASETFMIVVQVSDSASNTASLEVTLTVLPPAELQVLTSTLPRGFVGIPYRTLLAATGGVPPYLWKEVSGKLPAGLALDNGILSGIPLFAGVATFTIQIEDKLGATASRTLELPLSSSPPVADGTLVVQYRTNIASAASNQLAPQFRIVNMGADPLPLSELTLRYYFTLEGDRPLNSWCDWAAADCRNITRRFVAGPDRTYYLEIGFLEASPTIAPGSNIGEVQVRISKDDWSEMYQSDDYSFDPAKASFTPWERIPLFRSGIVVWGTPFRP